MSTNETPTVSEKSPKTSRRRKFIWVIVFVILAIFLYPYGYDFYLEKTGKKGPPVLPTCDSSQVAEEIIKKYGTVAEVIASFVPTKYLLDLKKSKTVSHPSDQKNLVQCVAEYGSLFGTGMVSYNIRWFDPEQPSLDKIVVEITAGDLPFYQLIQEIQTHLYGPAI